jgi:hypothetical protein
MQHVYGPGYGAITQFVKPVADFVSVDHIAPGCPVKLDGIKDILASYRSIAPRPRRQPPRVFDHVAKIEGHGSLQVDFERGTAVFVPEEGERVVEALVVGKTWQQAVKFYARICGICPVSHVFAATFALENALAVRPSTVTHLLRRLYASGQMLQSHLLHLYFMVLPSLAGRSSAIRMSIDYPAEFHTYLNIKRICERISKLIGGSSLHPATVTIGGFSRIPLTDDLFALRNEISETLDEGIDLVRLFASFSWPAARSASVRIAGPAAGEGRVSLDRKTDSRRYCCALCRGEVQGIFPLSPQVRNP